MNSDEQQFLNDLDARLWNAADRLRSNVNPSDYMHVVLGLVFLKYISDAFKERRAELLIAFKDPANDYYLGDDAGDLIEQELEARDYYTEKNVFWVPAIARWDFIKDNAKVAVDSMLLVKNGNADEYKFKGIGRLLDDALEAVEKENPKLKNVLDKSYARWRVDEALPGLIDEFSKIPFNHASLKAKDILGHVYEYFLGEFSIAAGKRGGEFYTPKSIVSLIVNMLEPFEGRVYDPCCGSGGFFVQSERFVLEHGGKIGQISIYGQEANPTTWRLASMNMAIRGLDFDFGKEPASTYSRPQHPDLRANFIMANPPFNMKAWKEGVKDDDPRWNYGVPPDGNANFAWMQHMIHHLGANGSMALLLANGSMSSNTNTEGDIRQAFIEGNGPNAPGDLVECMVALPGQLFTNTQIPACIWFLTHSKAAYKGKRSRHGEVLFIDARQLGYMKDRVLRDFKPEDIAHVANTFHAWQRGEGYEDVAGFCKSATLEDIRKADHVLTPGRYVGAAAQQDDGEPFEDKMARLTAALGGQFKESARLETAIRQNLAGLGYEV
ncbi:MAG: class I SAM-dependent DNA methyltransferase [Hydrogenophaga sp.]|nr:class I SAM-dependent DNA methyltransferase [Hydrogenophaga sp.]